MPIDNSHLIWVDLEMTGLEPQTDEIIEIATVVTDQDLNIVAHGPVIAIHQPAEVMNAMDEWNTRHHGDSGLSERVSKSNASMRHAEQEP